jgi:hypothetical protein
MYRCGSANADEICGLIVLCTHSAMMGAAEPSLIATMTAPETIPVPAAMPPEEPQRRSPGLAN